MVVMGLLWCDLPFAGRRAYIVAEATRIYDDAGQMIGVMETVIDRRRAIDLEAKLRGIAGLDGLTGLANRRIFNDALAAEGRQSIRSAPPLSLLVIDIDHFKQYNDSFGHQGGDQYLIAVAPRLARTARSPRNLNRPAEPSPNPQNRMKPGGEPTFRIAV